MSWLFLLPVSLGFAAVLQGGLNRQISKSWGLSSAVLLNSAIFMVAGLILAVITRKAGHWLPDMFRDKGSPRNFDWWYLIPGVLGFSLVSLLPLAISKMGALKVFVGLVAAQMLGSLLWDAWVENNPVTLARVGGASLAVLGAAIAAWKN